MPGTLCVISVSLHDLELPDSVSLCPRCHAQLYHLKLDFCGPRHERSLGQLCKPWHQYLENILRFKSNTGLLYKSRLILEDFVVIFDFFWLVWLSLEEGGGGGCGVYIWKIDYSFLFVFGLQKRLYIIVLVFCLFNFRYEHQKENENENNNEVYKLCNRVIATYVFE